MSRGRLAKSFYDAAFGEFFRQLEYKAKWYGRTVVKADRFYPSSKTCSCCGWINKALTLSERKWRCDSCETLHDRDVNAAINLRTVALGYSETQNACEADVSRGEIHATC